MRIYRRKHRQKTNDMTITENRDKKYDEALHQNLTKFELNGHMNRDENKTKWKNNFSKCSY